MRHNSACVSDIQFQSRRPGGLWGQSDFYLLCDLEQGIEFYRRQARPTTLLLWRRKVNWETQRASTGSHGASQPGPVALPNTQVRTQPAVSRSRSVWTQGPSTQACWVGWNSEFCLLLSLFWSLQDDVLAGDNEKGPVFRLTFSNT